MIVVPQTLRDDTDPPYSSLRLAWWRTSARIRVRRQSRSSTSSSAAPVQRVTASTPLDSPTCLRRSSSQATERPESLRGAPSACDSSSKSRYILRCLPSSPQWKALTLTLSPPAGRYASLQKMLHLEKNVLLHLFRC